MPEAFCLHKLLWKAPLWPLLTSFHDLTLPKETVCSFPNSYGLQASNSRLWRFQVPCSWNGLSGFVWLVHTRLGMWKHVHACANCNYCCLLPKSYEGVSGFSPSFFSQHSPPWPVMTNGLFSTLLTSAGRTEARSREEEGWVQGEGSSVGDVSSFFFTCKSLRISEVLLWLMVWCLHFLSVFFFFFFSK